MPEPGSDETFAEAVARANGANEELMQGRAAALKALFSHSPDASVLGGFGGWEIGWEQIGPRLDWVADSFESGHFTYEPIVSVASDDMGLIVQIERGQVQLRGHGGPTLLELRVTMTFRRESGEWRLVCRHADEQVEKRKP